MAQGWDNTAFLVSRSGGEDLVFRFPRRAMALPGIRRELAWLPTLAPLLPIAIPVPQFQGTWAPDPPGDGAVEAAEAWPFWGASMLPGDELALTPPPAEERIAAAGELGAFLRALHSLEPAALNADPAAELLVDPMHRGNPAERVPDTLACLERLARLASRVRWMRPRRCSTGPRSCLLRRLPASSAMAISTCGMSCSARPLDDSWRVERRHRLG